MKAIVYHRYGGPEVLAFEDVPKPTPTDNEVLIRVYATTVSTGDWRARSLDMPGGLRILGRLVFGIFGPRQPILGTELAGVIEAVGPLVTRFNVGDAVFAFTGRNMGCHAEYRTVKEDGLIARKPSSLSFEEAAALSFGGTTALAFLKGKGKIKAGDEVLVVGASGSVGTAAVQIAKHFGAEVTGVSSAANTALVRSLGAYKTIDYTTEDFTESENAYDIILDTTGTTTLANVDLALKPGGRLLAVQGTFAQSAGFERAPRKSDKRVIGGVPAIRVEDIRTLAQLAVDGRFKPVIDRCYPLANAADAHDYVDKGRKRGNVVLSVMPGSSSSVACILRPEAN